MTAAKVKKHIALGVPASDMVRRASAGRHLALEELPAQARMLCDDYEVAEYVRALQQLYGFYEPLASGARYGAHIPEALWRLSGRLQALAQDLIDLGMPPLALKTIPRCASLPALRTPDRELGCAYVIEGSTLGGRYISKHLALVFARQPRAVPMQFLAGNGNRIRYDWQRFCSRLNADALDVAEVCTGACATFDALIAWLSGPAIASVDISGGLPIRP